MATGRKLINDCLRSPLASHGWTPRAAGWFTTDLTPGHLGVIAVGTATEHAATGTAQATLYVHLRDEAVERDVSALCQLEPQSYRDTTAVTSIGHLMPEHHWHEWLVTPDTARTVAAEMADAAITYAKPHLLRLTREPSLLLDTVKGSPSFSGALGMCRAVVLLAHMGDVPGAQGLLNEQLGLIGSRNDAAALSQRQVGQALQIWLAPRAAGTPPF